MAGMLHSTLLFVKDDGMSMEFNVRLCKDKDKIIALIEHGGGLIQRASGLDVIRLIEPGCKVLNFTEKETVLYVKYILDCVEKNRLLDMTEYTVKLESVPVSDISSSNSDGDINNDYESDNEIKSDHESDNDIKGYHENDNDFKSDHESDSDFKSDHESDSDIKSDHVSDNDTSIANKHRLSCVKHDPKAHRLTKCTRLSIIDDERMIQFLLANSKKFLCKSKKFIHKQLMKQKLVCHRLEPASLRWQYIIKHIADYNLSRSEENLLKEILLYNTPFFREENLKMINYIIKEKLHEEIYTMKPYEKMAEEAVFLRSSTLLKKHFIRRVLPNLRRYNLSDHDMSLFGYVKRPNKKVNAEPVDRNDTSNGEESSSEHDFKVCITPSEKKSKQSNSENSKAPLDNSNVACKPLSTDDSSGKMNRNNSIRETNCRKVSKWRFCRKVAKKCKRSEKYDAGLSSDDFSSGQEMGRTSKRKKSSPPLRNKNHLNQPTCSSDKVSRVQSNMANGTDQCAALSKRNPKVITNSNSIIAEKVANILQKIAVGFDLANEDAAKKTSVSYSMNRTFANKENEEKRKSKPAMEEKIASCQESTQDRMKQQSFKFFDTEKCSLSFTDSLGVIVTDDNSQSHPSPCIMPTSSNQHAVKKISTEKPTELNDSLELETNVLIPEDMREQEPPSSGHSNVSRSILENCDVHILNNLEDRNDGDNLKNLNKQGTDLNAIQRNDEVQEDDVEDMQIAESPEEMISPTPQLLFEALSPEQCEVFKLADEESHESSKQASFLEIVSILKRMERIVMSIEGNCDLKNDLQNIVNELFSLLYQQRFKCSIPTIMNEDELSITDKAILLKYIAYTKSRKPPRFCT